MKCPHLIKWITFACKAKDQLYFPSSFQLQEYCNRKEHKKCPFHCPENELSNPPSPPFSKGGMGGLINFHKIFCKPKAHDDLSDHSEYFEGTYL